VNLTSFAAMNGCLRDVGSESGSANGCSYAGSQRYISRTYCNSANALNLCSPVAEQFLAFVSKKTTGDGYGVIALLEDQSTGDETSSPLVIFRTALATISGNICLGNAVDNRANSRPHAGTCAHGAGLMRGVEDEVGQVATIAA
jgi:hypothetical protein